MTPQIDSLLTAHAALRWEELRSHITALEAELAEARKVIDDAPHFEDCAYINGLVSSIGRGKVLRVECSCWKRNAARSKP
jgi:hypothetical protein